jgi:hypothetical protein
MTEKYKNPKSRKARYVERLVETLADLALRGVEYRMYAFREPDTTSSESVERCGKARQDYEMSILTMKACLAEILEENPKRVSELMSELDVRWKS